jgi:proline iminopeptidase
MIYQIFRLAGATALRWKTRGSLSKSAGPSKSLLVLLVALASASLYIASVDAREIETTADVSLGGIQQRVWLRGKDQTAPILIVLHGGPGTSETGLFRHYDAALEQAFLVVYWDQRGTGRSYVAARRSGAPLTLEALLHDLDDLVDYLGARFGARQVVLLGHSFGTVVAIRYASLYPEKVAALVSISQVVTPALGDRMAWEYALDQARRRQDAKGLRELTSIAPPFDVDETLALDRWLERYGGVFHGALRTRDLIVAALAMPEVTLRDLVFFGLGNRWSLAQLQDELRRTDLRDTSALGMPVFLIEGRFDQRTPPSLAAAWWSRLDAPCKRLYWFEASAHNLPFEQPERFVEVLNRDVTEAIRDPEACRGEKVRHVAA